MSSTSATLTRHERIRRPRLPVRELLGTAVQALRTGRLRAALSALGIAIGIGAMVAVIGVSASAQANLLAEIDALGTNLLTVTPGQNFLGNNEVLPATAVAMIKHMQNVISAVADYQVSAANVYRTPLVPAQETGGIGVDATAENLPEVMGAKILQVTSSTPSQTATPKPCSAPTPPACSTSVRPAEASWCTSATPGSPWSGS